MRAFLIVVVVLLAGIAALGFYRGWFHLSADNTDQKSSTTFTVDQNKISADGEKAKESVQEFGDKTKEAVGGSTEKDASEEVRGDADRPVSAATESSPQTKEEFQE